MSLHEGGNCHWVDPLTLLDVKDGDEFFKVPMTQILPDTEIMADKKNLKFSMCGMTNVKMQPTWKTDGMCQVSKSEFVKTKEGYIKTKHYGRSAQVNLLSKTEMKAIAVKIKKKSNSSYKRYMDATNTVYSSVGLEPEAAGGGGRIPRARIHGV